MLATDFANFEKGERQRLQLGSVLGTGVFCSDGMYIHIRLSSVPPRFLINHTGEMWKYVHRKHLLQKEFNFMHIYVDSIGR